VTVLEVTSTTLTATADIAVEPRGQTGTAVRGKFEVPILP